MIYIAQKRLTLLISLEELRPLESDLVRYEYNAYTANISSIEIIILIDIILYK